MEGHRVVRDQFMQSDFTPEACRNAMIQTVEHVFSTIMEAKVEPGAGAWRPGPDAMTAMISFVGAWRGGICLQCTSVQAKTFAVMFLGSEEIDGPEEDSRDVLGELLNIIAGNLKPALPRGAITTVPTIVEGCYEPFARDEAPFIIQTPFALNKGRFWLTFAKQPGWVAGAGFEMANDI